MSDHWRTCNISGAHRWGCHPCCSLIAMLASFLSTLSRCRRVFFVLLIWNCGAFAQTNAVHITPRIVPVHDLGTRSMRVNVNLVLVPVSVTDTLHRPVMGLEE